MKKCLSCSIDELINENEGKQQNNKASFLHFFTRGLPLEGAAQI